MATEGKADEVPIRTLIADWVKALRSKTANAVISHRAGDFVHFSLAPPLQSIGTDAKGLEAWFSTWQGPIGYEIHDLDIEMGGDIAFSRSLNRMGGTKNDGHRADLWFRQTLCFRKAGGVWKIAHEHDSVPFYMDGGLRAAADLEP